MGEGVLQACLWWCGVCESSVNKAHLFTVAGSRVYLQCGRCPTTGKSITSRQHGCGAVLASQWTEYFFSMD
eukprot:360185-Chlamydomonas_euryale.AAC.2